MTTTIRREFTRLPRPQNLPYEPEWDPERGFFGYVIEAPSEVNRLLPDGSFDRRIETVRLVFERAFGRMIYSSDSGSTHEIARRIGLEVSGSGPLCYRMPWPWYETYDRIDSSSASEESSWTISE